LKGLNKFKMKIIKQNFLEARKLLDEFIDNNDNWKKLEAAGNELVKAIKQGGKILACGNGGSMSDAMHFAQELTGRFREDRSPVAAIAISDPAYISCAANDYGYESIFSRYIEAIGCESDVLVAISTSGNSTNMINAVRSAIAKGMVIIGITGKDGGEMAKYCDIEIRVPHSKYSDRIQEIHIKILHSLIHYIELNL
jgi:D-sedoheptulose 7-phosphate isomerase